MGGCRPARICVSMEGSPIQDKQSGVGGNVVLWYGVVLRYTRYLAIGCLEGTEGTGQWGAGRDFRVRERSTGSVGST